MRLKMCTCKWSGLMRPTGPIKIKKTRILSPDVMVARLSGKVNTQVAVVKHRGKFYFDAPKELGGMTVVPADYLTDAVNYRVWELNEKMKRQARKKKA